MALHADVRELRPEEYADALALALRVFGEFEAPDYTPEGAEEFQRSLRDGEYLSKLRFYGAFLDGEMIGTIATRNAGAHIALFFVDGAYHRRGVGRQLFRIVLENSPEGKLTVNSSPFAVPVYHALGFRETDGEQTVRGLRFTPMAL